MRGDGQWETLPIASINNFEIPNEFKVTLNDTSNDNDTYNTIES